jgi:hypothetical protein
MKFVFERTTDARALSNFSCGIDSIDDFIHHERHTLSFHNRIKGIKFACFWAEIKKNTWLLQKRQLKKKQLSIIFLTFVPI